MVEWLTFTVDRLKILWSFDFFGKCLSSILRSLRAMSVLMFFENGGLNQVIVFFLLRFRLGLSSWYSICCVYPLSSRAWFDGLSNKTNLIFLTFDIVEFYPSSTETILRKSLEFAQEHTTIKDIEIDATLNARQTLMFTKGKTWSKRNASNCFDVAMGSYDGAEICELVGLFVLDQLKKIVPRQNIGLYRDDGLAVVESTNGPKADKTRKDTIEIFKTFGLKMAIEANLKAVNFLDVTLNLDTGLYQPYWKPNDQTRYVHAQSNHPPAITKNLPKSIEQRLLKISSNKEVFEKAAPYYEQALQDSRYTQQIEYQEERQLFVSVGSSVSTTSA